MLLNNPALSGVHRRQNELHGCSVRPTDDVRGPKIPDSIALWGTHLSASLAIRQANKIPTDVQNPQLNRSIGPYANLATVSSNMLEMTTHNLRLGKIIRQNDTEGENDQHGW